MHEAHRPIKLAHYPYKYPLLATVLRSSMQRIRYLGLAAISSSCLITYLPGSALARAPPHWTVPGRRCEPEIDNSDTS